MTAGRLPLFVTRVPGTLRAAGSRSGSRFHSEFNLAANSVTTRTTRPATGEV